MEDEDSGDFGDADFGDDDGGSDNESGDFETDWGEASKSPGIGERGERNTERSTARDPFEESLETDSSPSGLMCRANGNDSETRTDRATLTNENPTEGRLRTGSGEILVNPEFGSGGAPPSSSEEPATPTERSATWSNRDGDSEGSSAMDQFVGAVKDFFRNRTEMIEANTKGADKYYHCMANCDATSRGNTGERTAEVMSLTREATDVVRNVVEKGLSWEASLQDCASDMESNRIGREGGRAGIRCEDACGGMRPRGLQ